MTGMLSSCESRRQAKLLHPRPRAETTRPERPSRRYVMSVMTFRLPAVVGPNATCQNSNGIPTLSCSDKRSGGVQDEWAAVAGMPLGEPPDRDRPAHEVALTGVTAELAHLLPRRGALDALRDDRETQAVSEVGDGAGDGGVVGVVAGRHHEVLVDLQLRDREPTQVGQARVAGAEVVDRQ